MQKSAQIKNIYIPQLGEGEKGNRTYDIGHRTDIGHGKVDIGKYNGGVWKNSETVRLSLEARGSLMAYDLRKQMVEFAKIQCQLGSRS